MHVDFPACPAPDEDSTKPVARTPYQEAIAAAVASVGHAVEWKPAKGCYDRGDRLHIDGEQCGSSLTGDHPEVGKVIGLRGCEWRSRRLSADPLKAAKALLERHAAVIADRKRTAEQNARADARQERQLAIEDAIGDVPAHLTVKAETVSTMTVSVRVSGLTVEEAALLGDALRTILGEKRAGA